MAPMIGIRTKQKKVISATAWAQAQASTLSRWARLAPTRQLVVTAAGEVTASLAATHSHAQGIPSGLAGTYLLCGQKLSAAMTWMAIRKSC
jgi:hypothetical protein